MGLHDAQAVLPRIVTVPVAEMTTQQAAAIADELAKLDASGYSDAVKLAVRFTALTAKRLCEVRRAVWDEIDLEAKIWKIPGRS